MRTFIAFDFTVDTKANILKIQEDFRKIASGKIKYTDIDQFHLTTFFIGEVGEKGAGRLAEIINKTEISEPVSLYFDQLDYFPTKKNPRVIVLKAEAEPILKDLVKNMDHDLFKLGFKRDKKWLPHITLGRIRDAFSAGEFNFSPFTAKIESLTLYKSTLTKSGAIYEKLAEKKINQ